MRILGAIGMDGKASGLDRGIMTHDSGLKP